MVHERIAEEEITSIQIKKNIIKGEENNDKDKEQRNPLIKKAMNYVKQGRCRIKKGSTTAGARRH